MNWICRSCLSVYEETTQECWRCKRPGRAPLRARRHQMLPPQMEIVPAQVTRMPIFEAEIAPPVSDEAPQSEDPTEVDEIDEDEES